MINAYIITDFDNPVSQRYLDLSLTSFKEVEDIVNITPVQCSTPETTPVRYKGSTCEGFSTRDFPFYIDRARREELRPRFFGGTFDDGPVFQAIMHSQYKLIKRIAEGEEIAIMEHDACLTDPDGFRRLVDMFWGEVDVFMPGACMEFYGLSQEYARQFVRLLDNMPNNLNRRFTGPFGIMHWFPQTEHIDNGFLYLIPSKLEDRDKIALGDEMYLITEGNYFEEFDPVCKQYMLRKAGNTSTMNYPEDIGVFESMQERFNPELNSGGGGYNWGRDFVFVDD